MTAQRRRLLTIIAQDPSIRVNGHILRAIVPVPYDATEPAFAASIAAHTSGQMPAVLSLANCSLASDTRLSVPTLFGSTPHLTTPVTRRCSIRRLT